MRATLSISLSAMAVLVTAASAQPNYQRRVTIAGNGPRDAGRCTVEVVVDGAAEGEVRGDNASMRDLSGRKPQWRRVECTGALPPNPVDFRFRPLSGRGAQQLVRD